MRIDPQDDARWRKPGATQSAVSRQELPLSPQVIASLRTQAASTHKTGTGCGVTVGAIAMVCFALSLLHVFHVEPALVAFCGLMGALLALQLGRSDEGALLADAEGGVYVRLSGPVTLNAIEHEESSTTFTFVVCDEVFPIGLPTFLQLAKDETAVVEYLPHSRRILALRNSKGAVLE